MDGGDTCPWIGSFDDLNPEDRLSVAQLVVDGRAVVGTADQIAARLKAARVLALLREKGTDRIVGVGSLKNPHPSYRLKTFGHAGVAIDGYEEAPELGYVVVAEDMRGNHLSDRIVKLIAAEIGEPAFATTDNPIMKTNLSRAGFIRAGRDWKGQQGTLSLWTLILD
jgi:hypothetical protein